MSTTIPHPLRFLCREEAQNTAGMISQTALKSVAQATTAAITFRFYRSIASAATDWDAAAPVHNLFLQRPYLHTLEQHPPEGMQMGYLVFYKGEDPVGVAICQMQYFQASQSIKEEEPAEKTSCFFTGLARWFKRKIATQVSADILIVGNMLFTGENAWYVHPEKMSETEFLPLLENSLSEVSKIMEQEGVRLPVVLLKDLCPKNPTPGTFARTQGYTEFEIQPSMEMELPFQTFEEYLGAMSTKYRTRAKRAFKKLGDAVQKREMTLADVQRHSETMFLLYKKIADTAGFNMLQLHPEYFSGLKRQMPEQFRVFGYFQEERLVAFFTTFNNYGALDAHFIGYEPALNHDLQLYQNMLYDIVRVGIDMGCRHINFARTALEIKSTVGAVPVSYCCYVRHQNSLANQFAGKLVDCFKPVETWVQRHPFKEELHTA